MLKRLPITVCLATIVLLLLTGCGDDKVLESQLKDTSIKYITAWAAKDFETVMTLATGEALTALQQLAPALKGADYSNKIEGMSAKLDHINKSKDNAAVELTYTQEQTVPGYGTSVRKIDVMCNLKKINGEWKVYAVNLISE